MAQGNGLTDSETPRTKATVSQCCHGSLVFQLSTDCVCNSLQIECVKGRNIQQSQVSIMTSGVSLPEFLCNANTCLSYSSGRPLMVTDIRLSGLTCHLSIKVAVMLGCAQRL